MTAPEGNPSELWNLLQQENPSEERQHYLLRNCNREETLLALATTLRKTLWAPVAKSVRETTRANRRAALEAGYGKREESLNGTEDADATGVEKPKGYSNRKLVAHSLTF